MPGHAGRTTGREVKKCKEDKQRNSAQAEEKKSLSQNKESRAHKNEQSNKPNLTQQQTASLSPVSRQTQSAGNTKNRHNHKRAQNLKAPIYGALDLGTNNCRLLLARPNRNGFQIVDAFSRIIRLGEGVSECGSLSKEAMSRTIDALQVCSAKLDFHKVSRARLVATEACRAASNSSHFLENVASKTGLDLEIICQETEAKLAVSGCIPLIDPSCDYVLIFDIGGGSSELIWLDIQKINSKENGTCAEGAAEDAIVSWVSLPVGVVTLAEKFGGRHVCTNVFEKMVNYVKDLLGDFATHIRDTTNIEGANIHYLGTSGTVTTLAGVHLCLETYDRQKIDGIWMQSDEVLKVSEQLLNLNYRERSAIPSIGRDRADLVMGGCAILEAMLETWPTTQLRVADRGLREGILANLMAEDGFIKPGQCWQSMPKRSRAKNRHNNRSGHNNKPGQKGKSNAHQKSGHTHRSKRSR